MKENINTIGTIITIVALVIAIVLVPYVSFRILAGLGVVHTMFYHDEHIKRLAKDEYTDKYNAEVDRYNASIDNENKAINGEEE